jgi:hypothetical protein
MNVRVGVRRESPSKGWAPASAMTVHELRNGRRHGLEGHACVSGHTDVLYGCGAQMWCVYAVRVAERSLQFPSLMSAHTVPSQQRLSVVYA